jgi:hypothetical protein
MYSCIVDQHIDPGIFLQDGLDGFSDLSKVGEIRLKDAYAGLVFTFQLVFDPGSFFSIPAHQHQPRTTLGQAFCGVISNARGRSGQHAHAPVHANEHYFLSHSAVGNEDEFIRPFQRCLRYPKCRRKNLRYGPRKYGMPLKISPHISK